MVEKKVSNYWFFMVSKMCEWNLFFVVFECCTSV